MNINDLPDEIINKIQSYIPSFNKSVCRRWKLVDNNYREYDVYSLRSKYKTLANLVENGIDDEIEYAFRYLDMFVYSNIDHILYGLIKRGMKKKILYFLPYVCKEHMSLICKKYNRIDILNYINDNII